MPYWDNNSSGAIQDPNFNYTLEQEQIKRQRALAQSQFDTKMPEGQMVSGWYVAPKASNYLAAGLQKMLGAYQLTQADQAEKDNASKASANVTALAQALQGVKGKQTGVDADGNPTYAPATLTDKLPVYQQLQNSGQFGQLVAQHGMEKDLSGPQMVKLGEGEIGYQVDPQTGKVIGQLNGGLKKTELDRKADMLRQAYPGASPQLISGLAAGTIIYDDNSGSFVDKATGKNANYGSVSNFPTANPQAAPAPTGPITAPARGQTFNGPSSTPAPAIPPAPTTAFPQANAQQPPTGPIAPQNSAQTFRQVQQQNSLAPQIAKAQDDHNILQKVKEQAQGVRNMLANGALDTGPYAGRLAEINQYNPLADQNSKDAYSSFDKAVGNLVIPETVSLIDGQGRLTASELKTQREAGLNIHSPTNANIEQLDRFIANLDSNIKAKQDQLGTYGVKPSYTPGAVKDWKTTGHSGFSW